MLASQPLIIPDDNPFRHLHNRIIKVGIIHAIYAHLLRLHSASTYFQRPS